MLNNSSLPQGHGFSQAGCWACLSVQFSNAKPASSTYRHLQNSMNLDFLLRSQSSTLAGDYLNLLNLRAEIKSYIVVLNLTQGIETNKERSLYSISAHLFSTKSYEKMKGSKIRKTSFINDLKNSLNHRV